MKERKKCHSLIQFSFKTQNMIPFPVFCFAFRKILTVTKIKYNAVEYEMAIWIQGLYHLLQCGTKGCLPTRRDGQPASYESVHR